MGSKKAKAMKAPQLTGPLRGMQQQSLYDLQRQASGKGPSLVREQLKAAQERSLASQLAAAQARPTRNVSGMQRQLIQERGVAGRELAQAGAVGQAAEQTQARDVILGQADQDLGRQASLQGLEANRRASNAAGDNQTTGALIGAGASLLALSDKDSKENVKPAEKKVKSFLDTISSKEYNYKPETGEDQGKKVGIIAQDLEKSEMGKNLIVDKNGQKHVDIQSGFGAMLAAQAELNKRLSKLEKKKS